MGRGSCIAAMFGELRDDLRLGFKGCPFDLRMIGVQAPDALGVKQPTSAIDAERPCPLLKLFWVLAGSAPGVDAGEIIEEDAERIIGDEFSTSLLPLANDDVK